ncbi:hypothetical protein D3C76_1642380 [compost metagenome]
MFKPSEMNRTGTSVRLLTIWAGTSSVTAVPLTYAVLLPMVIVMVVLPFTAVIFFAV